MLLAGHIADGWFGPGHRELDRIFANPKKSQSVEITHIFLREPLIVDGQHVVNQKNLRHDLYFFSLKRPTTRWVYIIVAARHGE